MGDFGAAPATPFEAAASAGMGLSADCRGAALFTARRLAVADAAARAVSTDGHGSALFLPLERDGTVAAKQPRTADDGP